MIGDHHPEELTWSLLAQPSKRRRVVVESDICPQCGGRIKHLEIADGILSEYKGADGRCFDCTFPRGRKKRYPRRQGD